MKCPNEVFRCRKSPAEILKVINNLEFIPEHSSVKRHANTFAKLIR